MTETPPVTEGSVGPDTDLMNRFGEPDMFDNLPVWNSYPSSQGNQISTQGKILFLLATVVERPLFSLPNTIFQ